MIRFTCVCGRALNLPDKLGGKFTRCPGCGGTVSVPEAPPGDSDAEPPRDASPLNLETPAKPAAPRLVPPPPGHGKRGAAPGPQVACPRCGGLYAADALFCPKCAVVLATGQPIAGVVPGGMNAPRAAKQNKYGWVKWAVVLVVLLIAAVVAAKMLNKG
jgi:hypothetical protein